MKKCFTFYFRNLILSGLLLLIGQSAFANHIVGMDLSYQWQSGNTYQITLVAYGDCGSGAAYTSLATATPQICIYNAGASIGSINLALDAANSNILTSPVCTVDTGLTTCSGGTIIGIKKFTYKGTYTLTGASHYWRFIFDGNMGPSVPAGRATSITNISSTPLTVTQLVDTLDNTYHNNSSPVLSVVPTPYYCLNNADSYNPGATDPNGDSLHFYMVPGSNNAGSSCAGAATATSVAYVGAYTATAPLATSSFSFDPSNGQILFTPNLTQRALVVYSVREYRNDTFIGTSQREMTFLVQTCSGGATPHGGITSATGGGLIIDSLNYHICPGAGPFTLQMNPTESIGTNSITVTPSGLPAGATVNIVNNNTPTPVVTFSWTATGPAPGVYTFYLVYQDNNCPISDQATYAFNITINNFGTITGTPTMCVGTTTALTNATAGGTWSSSNTAVATIGSTTGVATGVAAGTATISYGTSACAVTYVVTVNISPSAISGSSTVCIGTPVTLSDAITPGTWSSTTTTVATVGSASGVVTGVAAGTTTISYVLSDGCYITTVETVSALPPAITGILTVCVGATTNLTDATAGGTWGSSNANVTVGSTGIVTGVTAGTSTITYTAATGCYITAIVTINALPNAITPTPVTVCLAGTTALTDVTAGGAWSSSNTAVGTISGTGVLRGIAVGTTTVSYTVAGCSATTIATVNTAPVAIVPATATVCTGSTTNLTDATAGGVWSASNANATVSATGVVTGVTAGTVTISYAIGTCSSTAIVTVNATPGVINPTPVTICLGGTAALTDATAGGAWSSSNAAVGTISGTGVLTGIAVGTTTVSYTVTGCSATTVATVNTAPVAIVPATATVCTGSTTNLTDATAGGVWSASNANATVSATGVVTGVTAGTVTISYSIGTCSSTAIVTVNATPGVINPTPVTICLGGTAALTDATAGGAWSSSNAAVGTISGTGVLTGIAVGTTTVSYTVTGCSATTVATVNTAPVAIVPATATVCTGSTTNLTDATAGGVWSASNANATVSATGVVTGVTAGTVTISYAIGTCSTTAVVTVNATPGIINPTPVTICLGGTAALTDATAGGAWSSSNAAVGTISGTGVLTGIAVGTTTVSYTVTGCSATTVATVNTAPVAIVPATATVCTGSTVNLTDATAGGVWSASNGNATVSVTGVVSGVTVGTVTISYAIGTCYSTATVTVNAGVAAITPSSATLCIGNTTSLTDATAGGVWSSSSANATVTGVGVVTAISTGLATISYTLGSCYATAIINVASTPAAITPATANVCIGTTANLTDAVGGGAWTSSNGNATVGPTGIVTGVATGTVTISYSIGTCVATATVTVNPGTAPGTITGPTNILCPGNFIDLTDAVAGGVWSASNGNATVTASGVTTGVTVGTVVISYGVTSICGTSYATYIVTVDAAASSGAILGPLTVCVGSFDIYLDYTPGGVWSVTNGNAVISPAGVITAITAGPETIVYSAAGACTTSSLNITIIPATAGAGVISGPANVCIGSSITLSDPTAPGGTWSGTNTHATVGSATGLVTGVTAGLDTVIYTLTTACGTYTTSATVNVDATSTPSPIVGPSSDCVASTILLTDADAGGTWSSSNGHATVTPGIGLVTGVSPGIDTIKYTVINGCGLGATTKVVTVMPTPSAGTITGPSGVCIGGTITLTDATVPGGTWSASNGNATVSASGVVTGVTTGTDDIIYTITASCGTVSTTKTITVNPLPTAGTVLGPDSVCVGSTLTLMDFAAGGVWSAGNGNATITTVGVPTITVTGVSIGTDPISYTVTNSCGTVAAVKIISVINVPNPGVIVGISNVCVGSAITLTDSVAGGIWLSSNGTASIIGPGIVSGVSAGIDSIFYVITNMCGTNEARHIVNVNPLPVVPAIAGPVNQCVGTVASFTDGLGGGVWSISNATIASINSSTGSVTGLAAGIDTISYTVTNAFGCPGSATAVDTIVAIPVVSPVMGSSIFCLTNTVTLSDATAGGIWSSSNTAVGTVDAAGNVTGIGAGVVLISYTVSNMCGSNSATLSMTVNPLPIISAILGTNNVCIGATVTLSNTTAGGIWISSDTTIASINSSGVVTGVAAGGVTIIYQVTNVFGCVSAVSIPFTVNAAPVVAAITGVTNACVGSGTALNDVTGGGVWSASNTAITTVDALGNVTAVAGGVDTISYTVTSGLGCSASAIAPYTVNVMPVSSPILGTLSTCIGSTTSLSDAVAGGAWSSTNNVIAMVDPVTGIVSGVSAGADTIIYTVTNSCGSVMDSATVTINAALVVAPITGTFSSACIGTSIPLTDATAGGVWTSSDTTIAKVDASGNVTGISTGAATITYTVTTGAGCSSFVTYAVTIAPAMTGIAVVPAAATICHGTPVNMHVVTSIVGVTYQWLLNGNVIAGATNSGYIADSAGTYSLLVGNGVCTQTVTGTVVSNPPNPVIGFTSPDILYTGSFFSYQWYKNGVAIAGATSSTYVATGIGYYTVVATDINGCSDTSAAYHYTGGTTGVGNVGVTNIRIYPNPATSMLTVDAPVKVNVSLLGIDGKEFMKQIDAHTIDISMLPNGMYMVMIYDENNLLLSTSKFVKTEQ